jgi:starch synthase (maltosyl-transferring)
LLRQEFWRRFERMGRLIMTPPTGERLLRFVGDRVQFNLRTDDGVPLPDGWRVLLRTNLGRAKLLRQEIISSYPRRPTLANVAWHDVPLERCGPEWTRELTLTETGYFRAKAYAMDPQGRQYWPDGDDLGISIHANQYRTANTIYCAFIRMFGETKHAVSTAEPKRDAQLAELDQRGYTVIPASGKIRDLIKELPFIIDTLGCRILQLLPVNPTPTTFARFGRFGSPYASQDLTAIDPALIQFDQRTTGIDQFRELTYATHARGARLFLDIVINHTGWGARLQETHPEWYLRDEKGNFVSPGAWGTTWEDLAELDHRSAALWEELAETFLIWCRRGVDGFRCDAGYKVPLRAWRYITARVLDEFPETVFLLEGLGGSWEATELLLTDGAMQWAYSELFQNYSGIEVASYLEYALRQSQRLGLYVHYSETHDNIRLATRGRAWSLLRNRLCALTSVSGGFGFTSGAEWLAPERINVHHSRGLAWGKPENIVSELAKLNELLRSHPCFFDGAKLTRVTAPDSSVYALQRESADGSERVLVVVNTDLERAQFVRFDARLFAPDSATKTTAGAPEFDPKLLTDLLGQDLPPIEFTADRIEMGIPPAGAFCLALRQEATKPIALLASTSSPQKFGTTEEPALESAVVYRFSRAQAAWGVSAASRVLPAEDIGAFEWRVLADWVNRDPRLFLGALLHIDRQHARRDFLAALFDAMGKQCYPQVIVWELLDRRRVTLLPPNHWLMLHDPVPFRATLWIPGAPLEHVQSIAVKSGHVAFFAPRAMGNSLNAKLEIERYAEHDQRIEETVRFLSVSDASCAKPFSYPTTVLLTNERGGMARLCVDFGNISSKYDCLLGANLHPDLPVDRHVFAKRARLWAIADGFITPLNANNLAAFAAGPPARWTFLASAGDGRAVEIEVSAEMAQQQNTTVLRFQRAARPMSIGTDLPDEARVSLTVRVDIEDRNFHWETKRNSGAEHHFASNTRSLEGRVPGVLEHKSDPDSLSSSLQGFEFTPTAERQLRVFVDHGRYHAGIEWCTDIPHPIEASRGQPASGDAFSPGWFDIPLGRGESATLIVTAETNVDLSKQFRPAFELETETIRADEFQELLVRAIKAFVVKRGAGKTVIAGYPWFLDWGRDSLICARGMIAGGMIDDVRDLLITFARFEENGTLPNTIHGENASNRDTSDAPLWFGVACEEAAPRLANFYTTRVDSHGRSLRDVLRSIAVNYMRGTLNGIRVDSDSALIWSPSHFTWMDTNYPAATPREGYPIEIQALWIRLLRQLHNIGAPGEGAAWKDLAARAEASLQELFWIDERGWFADVLHAKANVPARAAVRDDALRSNCLLPISLGLFDGERARRTVEAALRYLVVPGALRSLAPLSAAPPMPVYGNDGALLNDPSHPYWGRYEGDEDTRRKPAYHNGTAWAWTFPSLCEAMARAWDFEPGAVQTARAYLLSMRDLMNVACAGHIPEILDGDAPHTPRGCDAQAWSATEALRVWRMLRARSP